MHRRLSFDTITAGSRLALPAYPLLSVVLGLLLTFQDSHRTGDHPYMVVIGVMPQLVWGLLFLGIAAVELVGAVTRNRSIFVAGLILAAMLCSFWGTTIFLSALRMSDVSFTQGIWPVVVAHVHVASAVSLSRDRVTP